MSREKSCSLCCNACKKYQSLQNDTGGSNEIYEITIKYFDPVLLTENLDDDNHIEAIKILCQECWKHIKEFHEFQSTVVNARNLLQEKCNISQLTVEIKEEDFMDSEPLCKDEEEDVIVKGSAAVSIKNEKDESNNDLEDDINYDHVENAEFLIKSEPLCKDEEEDVIVKNEKDESDNDLEDDTMSINYDNDHHVEIAEFLIKSDSCNENSEESNNDLKSGKKSKQTKSRRGRKPERVTEKSDNQNDKKAKEADMLIAEWKPELECDLCGIFETDFLKLRTHFKNIHNDRCYIKCCGKRFFSRSLLVDHIRFHLDPDTHKCDICGKTSSCLTNLKLHKKTIHENPVQYECEVCHKLFTRKSTLKLHMLQHETVSKDFACQECDKAFVSEFQLKRHTRAVHNDDWICDQCGKTTHSKQQLKKHLLEHSGYKKPKFPCDQCDAELQSRSSLKRHFLALHDSSNEYVCSICGKVSASKSTLLAHKKNFHEKERKHKCTYCDKAFKEPKVLREHIASHTGVELYQCPHCPQRFKVSSTMHHHRKRVHPVEWAEGKKNRFMKQVDNNEVKNQVLI